MEESIDPALESGSTSDVRGRREEAQAQGHAETKTRIQRSTSMKTNTARGSRLKTLITGHLTCIHILTVLRRLSTWFLSELALLENRAVFS